jgi:hypothetical protein
MMTLVPVVTLAEAKAWENILHDDDDAVLEALILTASETVLFLADGLEDGDEIPESVKHAALMQIGALYRDREGDGSTPPASLALANRYRTWGAV